MQFHDINFLHIYQLFAYQKLRLQPIWCFQVKNRSQRAMNQDNQPEIYSVAFTFSQLLSDFSTDMTGCCCNFCKQRLWFSHSACFFGLFRCSSWCSLLYPEYFSGPSRSSCLRTLGT